MAIVNQYSFPVCRAIIQHIVCHYLIRSRDRIKKRSFCKNRNHSHQSKKPFNLTRVNIQVEFLTLIDRFSLIFYLVSANNHSQSTVDEFLSNDATPASQTTTEQNHSILSFPEHDTSPSQISEKFIDHDVELKQKAQIIVDDSIQTAQEKYQKV